MNNKFSKINYDHVNTTVRMVIKSFKINKFPFDLFELIDAVPNLICTTYKDFSRTMNRSIESMKQAMHTSSNDGFLFKMINTDNAEPTYWLIYNADLNEFDAIQRIRFTIAHELGHYFLNHLDDSVVNLEDLSEDQYRIAESEANLFASDLLIPPILIPDDFLPVNFSDDFVKNVVHNQTISQKNVQEYSARTKKSFDESLNILETIYLSQKFDVTFTAAANTLSRFFDRAWLHQVWHYHLSINNAIFLEKHELDTYLPKYGDLDWINIIDPDSNKTQEYIYCKKCHAVSWCFNSNSFFCPVCRSKDIEIDDYNFRFRESKESTMFDYFKYDVVGEHSHISLNSSCPRCKGSITPDHICDVCGLFLENVCTGIDVDTVYNGPNMGSEQTTAFNMMLENKCLDAFNRGDEPLTNQEIIKSINSRGCGQPQSGKARFCSKCGSVTTFYVQNMFKDWKKEQQELSAQKKKLTFDPNDTQMSSPNPFEN